MGTMVCRRNTHPSTYQGVRAALGILFFALSFSFSNSDLSFKHVRTCKNCGDECQTFSSFEGIIAISSSHEPDAECEWIIAPAHEISSKNQIFSIALWSPLDSLEPDHGFIYIYACDEPSCSKSRMSFRRNLSGMHTGFSTTIASRAILLRFSSNQNHEDGARDPGEQERKGNTPHIFSVQWAATVSSGSDRQSTSSADFNKVAVSPSHSTLQSTKRRAIAGVSMCFHVRNFATQCGRI